jgi:hypothetical protein
VLEGSRRLIAATHGSHPQMDERVALELRAYRGGRAELRLSVFEGVRFVGERTLCEGNGALLAAGIVREFNQAIEKMTGKGFEGLSPIPVEYALEIVEAVAYVGLSGRQPLLDEKFRIKTLAPDEEAVLSVSETVAAELHGDAFEGFTGFVSFDELRNGALKDVPQTGGVYLVVRHSKEEPSFLEESCGGHCKGKNPTELVDVLKAKWVPGTPVVYIGKGDNLRDRLRGYAAFGAGRRVGHRGGRYIWQLADRDELVVAWKPCQPAQTAAAFEAELVKLFKAVNGGRLPFANIADPSISGLLGPADCEPRHTNMSGAC